MKDFHPLCNTYGHFVFCVLPVLPTRVIISPTDVSFLFCCGEILVLFSSRASRFAILLIGLFHNWMSKFGDSGFGFTLTGSPQVVENSGKVKNRDEDASSVSHTKQKISLFCVLR